jgi:hypothetical protein
MVITLFSMTIVFCGTDNIMQNTPQINFKCGNILQNIISPQNIVMDLILCYDIMHIILW